MTGALSICIILDFKWTFSFQIEQRLEVAGAFEIISSFF